MARHYYTTTKNVFRFEQISSFGGVGFQLNYAGKKTKKKELEKSKDAAFYDIIIIAEGEEIHRHYYEEVTLLVVDWSCTWYKI